MGVTVVSLFLVLRLNEVADCGETEDWLQHFPEDDLRDVVLDKLRQGYVRLLQHFDFLEKETMKWHI